MNQVNKEQMFLATTALEDFWDTTKPIVFLGDWCLRYSRRSVWEPLHGEVLQGIWKDKKKFIDAYLYLQDVYERLLQKMVELLDEAHGEQHNIRYWRIIIGPWLFHYIDVLYDCYLCIQQAKLKYQSFDTIVLSEDSFITPRSTFEFYLLSQDDPYNLQIYSRILSSEGKIFRQKPYKIVGREHFDSPSQKNVSRFLKDKFITLYSYLVAMTDAGKSVFLSEPYFSRVSILKLFFKSNGTVKPIFSRNVKIREVVKNMNMRRLFEKISLSDNDFEKLLLRLLPLDIPYVFLESYKIAEKKSSLYPTKPRAIVSAISWYYDEYFKIWAAAAAESGSFICSVQHGGNYGLDQYNQALDHEIAIADRFYSWGWLYPEYHKRIVPIAANKLVGKEKPKRENKNNQILFAGTASFRYLLRLQYPTNNYLNKYYEDQIKFIQNLNQNYEKLVTYRSFIRDYGLDITQRIKNKCPNLLIEGWGVSFQKRLMNCKLFVCDHLSTVHAEALSLNIPTILFWDPETYIHRAEAHKYIESLHAIGILHYSPESAASKVNEVYDNIDDWWHERKRQLAISEFCDHYAKSSPNAINEWVGEFKKIIEPVQ